MSPLSQQEITDAIRSVENHMVRGTDMILCFLTLVNGHVVIGQARPLDPTQFDSNVGVVLARQDAEAKLAELLAFEARGPVLNRNAI